MKSSACNRARRFYRLDSSARNRARRFYRREKHKEKAYR